MIEKDQKVLVKSGSENRKPIRDGYITSNMNVCLIRYSDGKKSIIFDLLV